MGGSDPDRLIKDLQLWLQKRNFPVNPKVQIKFFPEYGFGLEATQEIADGEALAVIPFGLAMQEEFFYESSQDVQFAFNVAWASSPRDRYIALLVWLLLERAKGSKSEWAPWINTLPVSFDHLPAYWSEAEHEELKGTMLHYDVHLEKERLERMYSRFQVEYMKKVPEFFKESIFTKENFKWAAHVMDTRAVAHLNLVFIVPVLDLVNSRAESDPSKVMRRHRNHNIGAFDLHATKDYKKGEQVLEYYGHPNHELVLRHGFFLDENANECVKINIDVSEFSYLHLKHLELGDYSPIILPETGTRLHQFCVGYDTFEDFPKGLANHILLKHYGKDEYTEEDLSAENRHLFWTLLKEKIEASIENFPTTFTEDQVLLEQQPSKNVEMAIKYRLHHKKFLRDLFYELEGLVEEAKKALEEEEGKKDEL